MDQVEHRIPVIEGKRDAFEQSDKVLNNIILKGKKTEPTKQIKDSNVEEEVTIQTQEVFRASNRQDLK